MIRFCLTCIFLFVQLSANSQVNYADSLFRAGDYLGARVAYERSIFNNPDQAEFNQLIIKKALCHKMEGSYQQAYEVLQRATNIPENQPQHFIHLYESALLAYLHQKSDLALGHTQEIRYWYPDTTVRELDLLEILVLNDVGKWKEAQEKYAAYCKHYQLLYHEHLYDQVLKSKPLKPGTALTLSMVFPGGGQYYAGYFFKGFTSTVINTGLILFTIYSFSHGFYFSGAITGVGLFHLFYNGGASYARTLAIQKNQRVLEGQKQRLNSVLLGLNEGEKK